MDPSNLAPSTVAIIVACIALVGTLASVGGNLLIAKWTHETRKQVTVNGGANNPPTLKDDIHRVLAGQAETQDAVLGLTLKVDRVERVANTTAARLDAHLSQPTDGEIYELRRKAAGSQ